MEVLSKRGFFVYHELINLSMVFTDCRILCRFIPTLRVSIHEIFTLVWGTVLTDPFVVFLAERSRSWIESLRTGTGLSGSMKVIPPELCQSLTDSTLLSPPPPPPFFWKMLATLLCNPCEPSVMILQGMHSASDLLCHVIMPKCLATLFYSDKLPFQGLFLTPT